MKRAILLQITERGVMLFPQTGFGETIEAPSCATCKWAVDARVLNRPELLSCTRDNYDGSTMFTGGGDDPWVEPHHGCVQWEGK